jgi:hypothetical protein
MDSAILSFTSYENGSTGRIKVQVEVDRIINEVPNDKLKSSTQARSDVE